MIRLLKILPIASPRAHLFRRRLALTFLFNEPSYITKEHEILVNVSDFSRLLEKPHFAIRHDTDYGQLKALIEILDIAFDDGSTTAATGNQSKRVEAVCTALKDMSSKIRDTGMASLERTEAKQVIELTQFRLQYAVAKSRKGVSVLEQHFFQDDLITGTDGKKQTLLNFGNNNKKRVG